MSKLKGKVALITGASKGIGAAFARAFGAAGAAVTVNYASSKQGAEQWSQRSLLEGDVRLRFKVTFLKLRTQSVWSRLQSRNSGRSTYW